jgi:hypothetical protein
LIDHRSGLAVEKITERGSHDANLRVYMDGYVPGGRSENIAAPLLSGYRSTIDPLQLPPW